MAYNNYKHFYISQRRHSLTYFFIFVFFALTLIQLVTSSTSTTTNISSEIQTQNLQAGSEGEEIDSFYLKNLNETLPQGLNVSNNTNILITSNLNESVSDFEDSSGGSGNSGGEDISEYLDLEPIELKFVNGSLLHSPGNFFKKDYTRNMTNLVRPEKSKEDLEAMKDWGGSCLAKDWATCSKIEKWPTTIGSIMKLDCSLLSPLCLNNGWTVNKCHILCMSKCNNKLLKKYDLIVKRQGEC